MQPIRAKFRCLTVTQSWDGTTVVKLGPVKRKDKDHENSFFWRYTPSGEAEITYGRGHAVPFVVGAYYYIDMKKDDEGGWRISSIEQSDYNANVQLSSQGFVVDAAGNTTKELGFRWAHLKLGLSREATGATEALHPYGSRWAVEFTHAEPSDDSQLFS